MNNSFFYSVVKSSTDFKFYKGIFKQAFGKTVRYLLFLTLFITIILGVRYSFGINKFLQEGFKWITENTPYIEINDGVVTADIEQPFEVVSADFAMIIDTTGEVNDIPDDYETGILLTKDKLIIKQNEVRSQSLDLSKINKFRLDKESLTKWRKIIIFVLLPLMIVMQFIFFFVSKVIQALIAGVAVYLFKTNYKFSDILNVAVYALTPATLLSLFVSLVSPRPLPFFFLIYIGMYIAFVIGAFKQCISSNDIAVNEEAK